MRSDAEREWVSVGLTPAKLVSVLKTFDEGDLNQGVQLAEQMEEKDGHIYSVASTRRLALTGLDWEIVSAADVDNLKDRSSADKAAAFCRETLSAIESFEPVLEHLALAVGRNLSVAECVWGPDGLADLAVVPHCRLFYKTDDDAPELRILTKSESQYGIRMEPAKWIVHTPQCVSGLPMRGGLLRLTAAAYVAKAFSLKDWLVFVELFGMPIRVARYEPTATNDEKRELLTMLRSLGTDAAAIFSKAVDLEMKESSQKNGEAPFERVAKFFNAELSKAWLGQTLTTEVGDSGSRALGDVHDRVRGDLLAADIKAEGRTVRRDLLQPMTMFKFGPDCPVPYFRRKLEQSKDLTELADNTKKAVELGVLVDRTWFAAELGLQTTEIESEALSISAVSYEPSALSQPGSGERILTDRCGHTHRSLVLATRDQESADLYADRVVPVLSEAHDKLLDVFGEWIDWAIAAGISSADRLGQWLAAQVDAGLMPEPTAADSIADMLVASNLEGRLAASYQLSAVSYDPEERRTPADRLSRLDQRRGLVGTDRRLATGKMPVPHQTERQSGGRRVAASPRLRVGTLALAESEFANLPFGAAIAGLADRTRITRDEFDLLSREAKSKAFTVAWVDSARMLADIHAAAIAAMAEGETLRDFRLRLPEMADARGWTGERPWHADLVLRQQSMMATQAGRFSEMRASGVTHWRYSSLSDSRTRPEHAALDGQIFALSDRTFYPPWDFNCRCVAEPVFAGEVEDGQVVESQDLVGRQIGSNPETGQPIRLQAPGGERRFEWDPASFAASSPVDLSNVSTELRAALKTLLNGQGIETKE